MLRGRGKFRFTWASTEPSVRTTTKNAWVARWRGDVRRDVPVHGAMRCVGEKILDPIPVARRENFSVYAVAASKKFGAAVV